MRVLFAANSNGLGHATRSLPLIAECLSHGHEVSILSNGRALEFLRNEFKGNIKNYFSMPDYSFQHKAYTKKDVSVKRFLLYMPLYLKEFTQEHLKFQKIQKEHNFQRIITDSRYGIYDEQSASFLLNHHIKIPLKGILKSSEIITEFLLYAIKNKFKKMLIPDFEDNSLAGEYTHNFRYLTKIDYEYLGVLSMTKKMDLKEDIDYFFSISGPEPQRTVFEEKVLSAIKKIKDKKIVIALGKPESNIQKKIGNAEIYGFLGREKQTEMLNRSKLVITRSGYTTILDLAELGKKALMIPTKGQPEQEYLAEYHLKEGNFYCKNLEDLNLEKDLEIASRFPGYQRKEKTNESIKKFMKLVFGKSS